MSKYAVCGLFLVVAGSLCVAAPEPAIIQGPGQWTVEAKFEQPQQLVLPWGGNGAARYWYMIVSVTNRTNDDVDFYPHCELMTDTFEILPAGRNVPPVVFEQIKRRHQSQYPFLELLSAVENRILQGEDSTKDIAIIWRDFDTRATSFKVFLTGLSNETAVVDHPVATDASGMPVQIFLRKTLALDYTLRGDPALRDTVEVVYKDKNWVMR